MKPLGIGVLVVAGWALFVAVGLRRLNRAWEIW